MSEPSKKRLAIIGAGHLGRFHARLAKNLDQFDVVAVADPTGARHALAEEVSARPVADYRDLLGLIDAAVVATPTVTHRDITKNLLGRSIHCLVEKPLTPSLAEANELVELADQQGVTLQVGHVERFNPALSIAGPAVKDPKYITATRSSGYTFRSTDIGVVLDLMIHDIDLVLSMTRSPVARVDAMGMSIMGDHEDMATATIKFESGCVAQLTASRVSYAPQRTMQVYGTRGFAAIDFTTREATTIDPREDVLSRAFNAADLSGQQVESLKANLFEELLEKKTADVPAVNAIEMELREFADAISTGSKPRVDGHAGRDAVAVAERVLQAIDEHCWDGKTGRRGAFATPGMPVLPMPKAA